LIRPLRRSVLSRKQPLFDADRSPGMSFTLLLGRGCDVWVLPDVVKQPYLPRVRSAVDDIAGRGKSPDLAGSSSMDRFRVATMEARKRHAQPNWALAEELAWATCPPRTTRCPLETGLRSATGIANKQVPVLLDCPDQLQWQGTLERSSGGDSQFVASHKRRRQGEEELVHQILSEHRVEQRRTAFAQQRANVMLTSKRPQHGEQLVFGRRNRVRSYVSGAGRHDRSRRRIDGYSRAGIGEERDVERYASAAADDDRQRLNGSFLGEADLRQVRVAQEDAVALDAQGAGPGQYGVNLGAQQVKRGSVTVASERRRTTTGRCLSIRAADEVADDIRSVAVSSLAQGKAGVKALGRDRRTGRNGSLEQHQAGKRIRPWASDMGA